MNSKLISILTLVLISKLIECQDWCKLITSDGKYKGLGIYNRFDLKEKRSFVMYTKDKEWFFDITGNNPGVVLKDMDIQMIENSLKDNKISGVVIRFGLFFIEGFQYTYDCYVKNWTNIKWKLICAKNSLIGSTITTKEDFPSFDSFVTFKEYPIETKHPKGSQLLVVNKKDKGHCISYNVYLPPHMSTDTPLFIKQMDDWLFRQIEAVLDFNFDGNTGYLLIFNISGRPKYCFTSYGKDISPECKTPDKMKTLFKDCFQTLLTPQTVTLKTSTGSPGIGDNTVISIIVIVSIIFLIIVFIIGLYCVKKYHKKRPIPHKTSSTPNYNTNMTSISSVKTFQTKGSQSMIRPSDPNVKPKPK